MAAIFNEQRVLGVRRVADGTIIFNNQPVIGLSAAANGALFSENKRTLGVDVLDDDVPVHNEQPAIGYVLIEDGRKLYNGREVTPAWALTGDISAGSSSPPPLPDGYYYLVNSDGDFLVTVFGDYLTILKG